MKRLLIIDSNSIINRAYYGVRYLSAKDGTPTNAIYGFLNTLLKLIEEVNPDYICTAYDLKAPTFRHKMYSEYKAQRKPMPDGLRVQIPISKDILKSMKIKNFELEGYEADDIIGTVSKICDDNDVECYIATGDRDDLQLASQKVKILLTVTKNGSNETVCYDDKAVFERYGVLPSEFIDVKALMGDQSDNIPGVSGIGEKTAMSLIGKYKSIEYIYDHLDEVDLKGAALKKITEGRESAYMSKELATIIRNVPIDFKFEDCVFSGKGQFSNNEVFSVLSSLNLNSIIKRLNILPDEEKITKKSEDIFKDSEFFEAESIEALADFLKTAEDEISFVCELENEKPDKIAIAYRNRACAADLHKLEKNDVFKLLNEFFQKGGVRILSSGLKEYIVAFADSIEFSDIAYDVEIAQYLINPARSDFSIEALVFEYFGIDLNTETQDKQVMLFDSADSCDLICKKALAIEPLYKCTRELLAKNGQERLYYDIELPLVSVLADMQICGIKIDKKQLSDFSKKLSERIDVLVRDIYEYAGEKFNINSPKQLGVILFEKLGLKSAKKTKTGYSTGIEVLEKLRNSHPIIELLIEYRQLSKLKSTYCDGLAAVINSETGRIHSQFKQTVTVTGRISSTEPNMQNIPVRTELGREFRKMFIAENEGFVLVDADYSQIELRVLAHIANDETMIKAFCNNEDIHAVTASQVLGIPLSEVTGEQRSKAKAVNFGIVYGIGEYSLSQDLKISVKEAKDYISGYLDKYSGVRRYMTEIKHQAERDGYVKTMMNRIRYIPELKSTNHNIHSFGERIALNTPIQGSAADIIKLAMVRVHKRLKNEKLTARLILQVHDELIIEAPKSECEKVKMILREEMENAVKLSVPLVADTSSGFSWYEAKA